MLIYISRYKTQGYGKRIKLNKMSKLDIREAIDCAVVSCLATKLITLDKCKLMSVLKLSYTITWCQYRFKNCLVYTCTWPLE